MNMLAIDSDYVSSTSVVMTVNIFAGIALLRQLPFPGGKKGDRRGGYRRNAVPTRNVYGRSAVQMMCSCPCSAGKYNTGTLFSSSFFIFL